MIREITEVEFIDRFADLIDRFDSSIAAEARPVFAGAETGDPHEHTTRVHFLDELMELLGWSLGLGGDMVEEARLKGETTTFMDYLGKSGATNAPALLVEAKAWDKAFLAPRKMQAFEAPVLLGDGIRHWRSGRYVSRQLSQKAVLECVGLSFPQRVMRRDAGQVWTAD